MTNKELNKMFKIEIGKVETNKWDTSWTKNEIVVEQIKNITMNGIYMGRIMRGSSYTMETKISDIKWGNWYFIGGPNNYFKDFLTEEQQDKLLNN